MRRARELPRGDLLAVAFLVAVVLAVFVPIWGEGRYVKSDAQLAAFFEPIAFWSDHWIGGWPALADPVNYALYPARVALAPTGSFNALTIAAYLIAGTGLYAYLRVLGAAIPAALVSGLSLPFSGFLLGHVAQTTMVHTAAWVTPALAGLEATLQRGRLRAMLFSAGAVSCMGLAAHAQLTLYGSAVLGLYLLWRLPWAHRSGRLRAWSFAVAAIALGILLAIPALVLTHAYVAETPRKAMSYEVFVGSAAIPIRQLPSFFFPFLFGGGTEPYVPEYFGKWFFGGVASHVPSIAFLLAAPGVIGSPLGLGIFWGAIAVMATMLLVGDGIPWLAAAIHSLPAFGLFRAQGRHAFELDLALAVLAGFGCDALLRQVPRRAWLPPLLLAVGLFAAVFAWVATGYGPMLARPRFPTLVVPRWNANPAVWIPTGLAVVALVVVGLAASRLPTRVRATLVLAVLVLQTLSFAWFLPSLRDAPLATSLAPSVMERIVMEAMHDVPGRVLNVKGELGRTLTPERARLFGLSSLSWYGPLVPARAAELVGIEPNGRVDSLIAEPSNVVLDVYGVRYVIVDSFENPFHLSFDQTDRWRLVARGDDTSVHENLRARPLAWLVGTWRQTPDAEALGILRGAVDRELIFDAATTALTAALESGHVDAFDAGTVRARWTEAATLEIESESRSGGLLVVGVNALPGWHAELDGVPTEAHRADHALLAVRVPSGRHLLRLRYVPPGWASALGMALLAIAGTVGVALMTRRFPERAPS